MVRDGERWSLGPEPGSIGESEEDWPGEQKSQSEILTGTSNNCLVGHTLGVNTNDGRPL